MRDWPGLLVCLLVVSAVAGLGGGATSRSVATWYVDLAKPAWTPPAWVFGPAWTLLYAMMALSAWFVWRQRAEVEMVLPLVVFAVQLALNALWSPLFFGLRQPGWALLDIGLLWLAIMAAIAVFWRVSLVAGALLVPYWLWVSFAGLLNYSIWSLNR